MAFDVVIRGGDVVDGSGGRRRRADVAVQGDRVVAVGDIDGGAATVIDATGRIVTPGFVDVHTHYDAQVFWDGHLTPSSLHGVTTVLAGNCGFTIAPLSADPRDGEYLMRMLARVEGMPIESLRTGVPWSWQSTAEYLDAVDGRLGINAGFMCGHSTIRRIAMGDDAVRRPSTGEELDRMRRLLHDALEAGAIGFSSSWARTHNDPDGHMVPSRYASDTEIVELCRVVGEHPGTSLEFLPQVGPFDPWAVELMAAMSAAAQRPLNWNVLVPTAATRDATHEKLAASDAARDRGAKVVALVMPLRTKTHLSFASGFVLDALPGWEDVMLLPREEKLAVLSDPVGRKRLAELANGPGNPFPTLSDWSTKVIFDVATPDNEQFRGRSVGDIAAETGREAFDVLCDIAVADELRTTFGTPPPPATAVEWDARVEACRDPRAVIGASDAGAHLDLGANFNYATTLLAEGVRTHRVVSLEEAVRLITDVPARLYGLDGRGRVAEGSYADLVVLDPATVASHDLAMRYDLPGGAGRLYAEADGIEHVLVNGRVAVTGGRLTTTLAGRVLRSGRDTTTPSLN
jgi:N-acyl-D-aspartate/D-glutamate deacylase